MRSRRTYNSIKDVVEAGFIISQANANLSHDEYNIWFLYSSGALNNLPGRTGSSIYNNYLALQLMITNSTPTQKLNSCLTYMVEVMKNL